MFMAKSDLMSAFRILPVLPSQRFLLIMSAKDPVTKRFMFFVEQNLPFGPSSSCKRFLLFSDSLKHMVEHLLDRKCSVTNYLDDFMFIHPEEDLCNQMVRKFIQLCHFIGCLMSHEKTEWVAPLMTFLGILLDGRHRLLCGPEDKKLKALNLIQMGSRTQKKVTIKFVLRLTGALNFICKAVLPGCPFTRSMYDQLNLKDVKGSLLKQYHYFTLTNAFYKTAKVGNHSS